MLLKFTFTLFHTILRRKIMKNEQNSHIASNKSSDQHIYASKSQNLTKNQENYTENTLKSHKIPQKSLKIPHFLQKIIQNPLFSALTLIFFVLSIIISVLNIKTLQENKQFKSDNVTIYEMFDVINVTRIAKARQIKYLESLLEENNIYISPLYSVYIQEEMYEEHRETIEKFHKIDYNAVLDQYLNEDYNTMLYEMRIKELESREKICSD